MRLFTIGDKARIISVPDENKQWLNEIVTVCSIGGIGYEDDDVCVLSSTKMMLYLKEHQLVKVNK